MSCRSEIYTSNSTTQNVPVGGNISLGTTTRRFGNNISLSDDSIVIKGSGYYNVNATFTITATNAGNTNIYLTKDGVAIPSAVASVSLAVGDVATISINAVVREYGCCCDNISNLSFVLSGTAESITNSSVIVEKV